VRFFTCAFQSGRCRGEQLVGVKLSEQSLNWCTMCRMTCYVGVW